jgi:hypothetical protein
MRICLGESVTDTEPCPDAGDDNTCSKHVLPTNELQALSPVFYLVDISSACLNGLSSRESMPTDNCMFMF